MNTTKPEGWVKKFYLKFNRLATWDKERELQGPAVVCARQEGADGVLFQNVWDGMATIYNQYLVFSPTQVKSADPVVYDYHGNIIPLSKRFPCHRDRNDSITAYQSQQLI